VQIVSSVCYTYSCNDCYNTRSNDVGICFGCVLSRPIIAHTLISSFLQFYPPSIRFNPGILFVCSFESFSQMEFFTYIWRPAYHSVIKWAPCICTPTYISNLRRLVINGLSSSLQLYGMRAFVQDRVHSNYLSTSVIAFLPVVLLMFKGEQWRLKLGAPASDW